MAAYGERDLRRFPHAHILYEQAYAVGGKLQRNAEEKTTKQREWTQVEALDYRHVETRTNDF